MMKKILTVSIAAYNVADYIGRTLDSLVEEQKTLEKIDIIVVNDGSKDETLEIAKDYAEKYPNSIRIIDKDNGGYGSTINASLPIARGKYYKLLDGDDWYDKEGLKGFIRYLEETESDLVITPFYKVREDKKLVEHHPEISSETVLLSSLAIGDDKVFFMHGVAVKTKTLQSYGEKIAEHCFYTDIEFLFYSIAASESISRYDYPVYCYRLDVDGQSTSLAGLRKHYKEGAIVAKRICKCYCKNESAFRGTKKMIIQDAVTFSIYGMFTGHILADSFAKTRKELMENDNEIKRTYPAAYTLGNNSKIVRFARLLHFRPYWLIKKYVYIKNK